MDKLMEFLMEQEVRENETVEVDVYKRQPWRSSLTPGSGTP